MSLIDQCLSIYLIYLTNSLTNYLTTGTYLSIYRCIFLSIMVSHCCVWTPNIVPSTVTTLRFVNLYFIPAGLQCSNGMPWPLVSWTLDDLGTIRARRCDTHLVLPTSRKHHGVCMNFLWNYGIRVWYINIWGIWMGSMLPYIAAPWIRHGSWNNGIHVMREAFKGRFQYIPMILQLADPRSFGAPLAYEVIIATTEISWNHLRQQQR